jgi:hypothetical protein
MILVGGICMARKKIGITLTDDTVKNLEDICKVTGLTKSQMIALLINTYKIEKVSEKKA